METNDASSANRKFLEMNFEESEKLTSINEFLQPSLNMQIIHKF